MGLAQSPKIVTDGLVFAYDMSNGKSLRGAPVINTLPSPQLNGFPTFGNSWGTYNTNQYNNNAYFSIGTIVSVTSNIVTTSGNHPLRSYDVVTPQTTGGGLTAGVNYLVKKLSNTTFSLHTHNSSEDGSQGYINPATGNFKVYDNFANDVRISINATSFPTMWWGYPHLPNSGLVKEIIPDGFNGIPGAPSTNCIRLHFHRTDDVADGMAYGADAAVTAGNIWTASFWARAVSPNSAGVAGNNFQIYNYGGANSPTNPSMSWTLGPVGVWQRHSLTWTANNPLAISYWFPAIANCKFDISNIQYELGSIPNNFAPGTRSNTAAILDLTRRNTITATSLTYANNNTFSFNGANRLNFTLSGSATSTEYTRIVWIKPTQSTVDTKSVMLNQIGNNSDMAVGIENNKAVFHQYTRTNTSGTTDGDYTASGSTALSTNNIYMIAVTVNRNISTNNINIYLNGQLDGTASLALGAASSDNVIIGGPANDDYGGARMFYGDCYFAAHYNRALTAIEIQQNFNALRGRYGI